ncbi:hypothetical protein [Arthrobacter sp. UYCu512]|uniref:hypothetical protein n=1 Tax=Arthrobacter sp. UYCu512 TaxID=3156338 RepID=UPI00339B4C05
MDRRKGSDSKCCSPVQSPRTWQYYVDDSHESVAALDAWLESLSGFSRDHQLGEIDDLFEAAALGELEDTGDARTPIKPIRSDPDVYELRRKALSKSLRFYHAEPDELPDGLLALHKHLKSTDQQSEINFAVDRYNDGREADWTET